MDKTEGTYLTINVGRLEEELTGDNSKERICFMCRNNAQTLKLSSAFRKRGINHTLNTETTEYNYASWISELFFAYKSNFISRDDFIGKYITSGERNKTIEPETIWKRILYLTKSEDTVVVSDLLSSISNSDIDDAYFRDIDDGNILVSNIHKTKGREYEHVIIDNAFIRDLTHNVDDIGEYKILYVALTRAKTSVSYSALSDTTYEKYMKRYTIYKTQRKLLCRMTRSRINNFEFRNHLDINMESFLTTSSDVQDYLKKIKIGDPIKLKRIHANGKVAYKIIHYYEDNQKEIGMLNDFLRDDLMALMKLSESDYINLPDTITDLYVSGKYTYIATEDYLKAHPEITKLSPNGVWQWVEFVGIGHASYDTY